jgi:hypothetical protein
MKKIAACDIGDALLQTDLHATGGTFGEQHGNNGPRRAIAEELAERFFVPGDCVARDEFEEIARGVAGERGAAERWVLREEAVRRGVEVGKVTAPAAGDQDFFARLARMIHNHHTAAPAPRISTSVVSTEGEESTSFLKKRSKKLLPMADASGESATANQKSFASFLQKRRSFFLSQRVQRVNQP